MSLFKSALFFLKLIFFLSENTLDSTVLICTYQECSLVVRRLSWEMVLMHVIPKPECLRIYTSKTKNKTISEPDKGTGLGSPLL